MQDQYELYYTTYNQERDRIRKFYGSLRSEESNRMLKSQSLNDSLRKAEESKNEKQQQIKQKAHKFNVKAKIIQRKNNQMQEKQFLHIIKQKNELVKREKELERRLRILNAEQTEQIRQNQIYKSMKQKIYLERVEQHQLKIEQEHQQLLEQMNNKFQKVEQYIQQTRQSQQQKFRSLSQKYLTYKQKAENLVTEKTENTFQEALVNMAKREQLYDQFLEAKEKERKKIVRRNKFELVKFKRSKKKQESLEKLRKSKEHIQQNQKSISPSQIPKIIITEHEEENSKQAEVEVEVNENNNSYELTQTYDDKVQSSRRNLKEVSMCTNVNESSIQATIIEPKFMESPNYKKPRRQSEKERQYQILMKLRLNLKREREQLDEELNSFFVSQPVHSN